MPSVRLLPSTVAIAGSVLVGCASKVPELSVAEQWANTIRNYALIPVYPIREDVVVGDVRLSIDLASVDRGLLTSRKLGYLDLSKELKEEYEKRPSLPKTTADEKDGKRTLGPQPLADGSVFAPAGAENVKRLRLAALPAVKVARVARGSIGGAITYGPFGILGGASAQAAGALEISLTGVEELEGPPDIVLHERLSAECGEESGFLRPAAIRFALAQMIEPDPPRQGANGPTWSTEAAAKRFDEAKPEIAIVSRVFYARAIDYTWTSEGGMAAELGAVAEATKGLVDVLANLSKESGGAASGSGKEKPGTRSAGTPAAAEAQAHTLAQQARGLLSAWGGATAPGIVGSFLFVDSRGVTLREVFERPMAFGVQVVAYPLRKEPDTGACDKLVPSPGQFHPKIFLPPP